jgi:hypothetical protein
VRWLQRLPVWRYVSDYFPGRLVVTQKLDPSHRYVIGLHPHGIIGMSLFTNVFWDVSDSRQRIGVDWRVVTVTASFMIPVWRELVLACGLVDARPAVVDRLLQRGTSVMIVVGGALEALDARPGSTELTLARRKGFVRLALRHRAHLVPCFSFGENELYDQAPNPPGSRLRRFQLFCIKYLGFTLPIIRGRGVFQYSFGVLPHRRPVTTVIGAPLPLFPCAPEGPTEEQLDAAHTAYCEALAQLYDRHKAEYAAPEARSKSIAIVQ